MSRRHMTLNPVKPARYRVGKPLASEASAEEEDFLFDDNEEINAPPEPSHPTATSLQSDATNAITGLSKLDLERRRQAVESDRRREAREAAVRAKEEEGFVTEESEEEHSEEDSGSASEDESEVDSSEEEEQKRTLVRPTFIKKDKRSGPGLKAEVESGEQRQQREDERKAAADEIVQAQLRKNAEARAVGKKNWDDDEAGELEEVDDTDGLDPEAEHAAWKLREFTRLKRDREAIERAEADRQEIERRRHLSAEERDAEDQQFIAQQKSEKESKGQIGFMQKYYHKGAFFQDDSKEQGLDRRDLMGNRVQDDVANRELLPQYMQIRDMTKLGRKGRTKYKDLQSEDTGRWGQYDNQHRNDGYQGVRGDDRFRPDSQRSGSGATGANASVVAQRRASTDIRLGSGRDIQRSGDGTRDFAATPQSTSDSDSRYRESNDGREVKTVQSSLAKRINPDTEREPSRGSQGHGRPHSHRRSRSRSRSLSRSRSGSPMRRRPDDGYDYHTARQKRSLSPYDGRSIHDKRRRFDERS